MNWSLKQKGYSTIPTDSVEAAEAVEAEIEQVDPKGRQALVERLAVLLVCHLRRW